MGTHDKTHTNVAERNLLACVARAVHVLKMHGFTGHGPMIFKAMIFIVTVTLTDTDSHHVALLPY